MEQIFLRGTSISTTDADLHPLVRVDWLCDTILSMSISGKLRAKDWNEEKKSAEVVATESKS